MSRFWAADAASSSEEDERSDDESFEEQQQVIKAADRKFGAAFEESDSDSDDQVREVKSQKTRTFETINEMINRMKNARKNEDWPLIQDEFNNVNKQVEKSKMLIMQHGIPPMYIKMLAELEDHLQTSLKDKELQKKMKPIVQRALNQMKLQVKKHNENYKDQIADYRAHPEKYIEKEDDSDESSDEDEDESESEQDSDESASEDESSDDDIQKKPVPKKPAAKPAKKGDSESESEDSLFGDQDDESSSSDEEEAGTGRPVLTGRAKWLKKPEKADKPKKEVKPRETRRIREKVESEGEEEDGEVEDVDHMKRMKAKRDKLINWSVLDAMTVQELEKRVIDIVSTRGRKSSETRELLRQLEVLTKVARRHGPVKEIPTLMHLISMMFDSQKSIDDYMEHHQWLSCYRALQRVVTLVEVNKNITLQAMGTDDMAELALAYAKPEVTTENGAEVAGEVKKNVIRVVGSIESFINRLEDDYTKSLQQINPHTQEYVSRLADEAALVELEKRMLKYYQRNQDLKSAASIALLIIEHMYFKHDSHAQAVNQAFAFAKKWGNYRDLHPASKGKMASAATAANDAKLRHPASFCGNPTVKVEAVDNSALIEELANFVFQNGDERIKTRALLCLVFHHALHDRYYQARDLFLISHIQDFIERAEVRTQILYNRTLVSMGLCAFRLGLFQKAHDLLSNICSNRTKELLAQGIQQRKGDDRDVEQEKAERRRQMPYHMHINPDLLEACHLTCAMILELPNFAKLQVIQNVGFGSTQSLLNQPGTISRNLRKYLNSYRKQPFVGPPETTREHVLAATQSILSGNWGEAIDYIVNSDVWNLIPGQGGAKVKALLTQRIREESVRCFLLQHQTCYDAILLQTLSNMFEMDAVNIKKIVCKMIFQKEIVAALNSSSDTLHIYRNDTTPVQSSSVQLADKLSALEDSNERILDITLAGNVYGFKEDSANWKGGDKKGMQNVQTEGPMRNKMNRGTRRHGSSAQVIGRYHQDQSRNRQNRSRSGHTGGAGGPGGQVRNAWASGGGSGRHKQAQGDRPPRQSGTASSGAATPTVNARE